MTTFYIARLEHGGRYIDLNESGQYKLMPDFVPPRIDMMAQYAQGSAAGQSIGADVIGTSPRLVTIEIPFIITGSSDLHVNRALNDLNAFLSEATEADGFAPTYFTWRSNNDLPFDPVYGQANRRARIKSGYAEYGDTYSISNMRERAVRGCILTLTIDSIEGYRQPVAFASGCVFEDTIGTGDSGMLSRGVTIVPNAITNRFDRVGGDDFTILTPGLGVPGKSYIDKRDALSAWGLRGEHYTYMFSSPSDNENSFYRPVTFTAGTMFHEFSFLARKHDGSAVTASDVTAYFLPGNYIKTPTYTHVGNGWYHLSYSFVTVGTTGSNVGFTVPAGKSIYATAFGYTYSALSGGYSSQAVPIHGDFPGCSWAGTAWESGVISTPGVVKIPSTDFISTQAGTIRFFYIRVSEGLAPYRTQTFIDSTSNVIKVSQQNNTFTLLDSGGTATGTKELVLGTAYVFHVVWGPGQYKLYINGELIVNGNHSQINNIPANLFIGTSATGPITSDTIMSTFSSLQVYACALTQEQVTLDYNNVSPLLADGKAESLIPYIWTIDGDGVLDTSVDSTHADYGFIAGVGGDISARTIWNLYQEDVNAGVIAMGLWDTQQYVRPDHYGDFTSQTSSVGSTPVNMASISCTDEYAEHLSGKLAYFFVECSDSGIYAEGLRGRILLQGTYLPYFEIDTTGIYSIGPLSLSQYYTIENSSVSGAYTVNATFYMERDTGSAHNATCSKMRAIFDRFGYLSATGGILDGSYAPDSQFIGSPMELTPNRYNQFVAWAVKGGFGGGGSRVANAEVVYLYIIPRYLTM